MNQADHYPTDLPTPEATDALAQAFARCAHPPLVVLLDGDLGAGKTSWVRSVLRSWGWTGTVRSPTYTLHETYDTPAGWPVHHLDLYRLGAPDELDELGLADLWPIPAVWFIEWPSKGKGHLPPADIRLAWQHCPPGRHVQISALSSAGTALLRAWITVIQQHTAP